MELVKHETCLEYFRRRLRGGWKCISLEGHNAVLLSPDGVRRELDLRNDIETLRPIANGTVQNIAGQYPTSGEHWDKVNEAVPDDEATYVRHNLTSYATDTYELAHPPHIGVIDSVTIHARCYGISGNYNYGKAVLYTYGTEYYSDEVNLYIGWYDLSKQYTTNPSSGNPWTWDEIDTLEAGVALKSSESGMFWAICTQVYVEIDYTSIVAPTVTTQACTNVQATTATGNGNITNIGGENCTRRGFCYKVGTTGDPTTADSVAYDDGSFGTGAYTKGITGLSPGTSYRVRAYAVNSAGTGYGTTVQILTKPAAPTNVQATDGAHTDKVVVTWTKSTGATGYQVYRDGTPLGWLGDVATFDDTGAGAPTVTPGTASASDGTQTAHVVLSLAGEAANNGATHTYKVRAKNATGESVDSGTNTGYRGVGALTRQWYRSAGDSDASYSLLSGATTDPYNDTTAPAPTVTPGDADASDGLHIEHVALSLSGQSANVGAGRYYKCLVSASGASSQYSSFNRGYRGVGSLTYQWQRSAADSDADYSNIAGATTASYNDTGAPENGDGRYYKCVEDATGAAQQISSVDRGFRIGIWVGKISGVTNPAKVMGVDVANIAKVKGVASA